MKNSLKKIAILSACLIATFVMTQINDVFVESAFAKSYKIGAVFSVTGRASFLGDPEKKTVEMVVEQVNQNGGINGVPIELIVKDSQGDATKANLAVKKLSIMINNFIEYLKVSGYKGTKYKMPKQKTSKEILDEMVEQIKANSNKNE